MWTRADICSGDYSGLLRHPVSYHFQLLSYQSNRLFMSMIDHSGEAALPDRRSLIFENID